MEKSRIIGDSMKYLTEKEFEKKLAQIQQKKRQYEMKKELREAKRRFPKLKKPNTSKLIVFVVFLICLQILWFSEHMVVVTGDTSYMYVLIGIPAALIPTVISYYNKAKAENLADSGYVYETRMAQLQYQTDNQLINEEENKAAG
jgi:hypothetical protein